VAREDHPWLRLPEIGTIFVGALSNSPFLGQTPQTNFEARFAAYQDLEQLPRRSGTSS
jgi:hypothetical protein